jgi:general secretion pathway protein G
MKRTYLAVTVAILMVAIEVAHTQHRNVNIQHARQAELRGALASIRRAITTYHAKHQRNPATLNDLVHDGELGAIPPDPVTGSNATWKTTVEESVHVDDFQPGAANAPPTIVEVHSGASGADSSGRAFADY